MKADIVRVELVRKTVDPVTGELKEIERRDLPLEPPKKDSDGPH